MKRGIIRTSIGTVEKTKRTEKFGKSKRCYKCGLTLPINSFHNKTKLCKHCQAGAKRSS